MTKIYKTNGEIIQKPSDKTPRVPGFYILVHEETKKIYAGSTNDLYSRESKHRGMLQNNKHSNKILQETYNNSINKEVTFLSLNTETREEAFELEQSLINGFIESGLLFNISKDAKNPNKGLNHSDETISKMSQTKLGKVFTDEHKQNLSISHLGKPVTNTQLKSLDLGKFARMKPVVIDNVQYESVREAAKELKLHEETARRRFKDTNTKFPNWKYA